MKRENHRLAEKMKNSANTWKIITTFYQAIRSEILTKSQCVEFRVINTADTTQYTNSKLTQGYQVWLQSRSNWPQSGQILDFFRSRQYILALDLFHLGPIGSTLEPTLKSLPDTRNQYYVCVNFGLPWFLECQQAHMTHSKQKSSNDSNTHTYTTTVYACVTYDLVGNYLYLVFSQPLTIAEQPTETVASGNLFFHEKLQA